MSDSEANKVIVRRYFEMFDSGDMNKLADIVSDDYGDKLEGQSSGIAAALDHRQQSTVDEKRNPCDIARQIGAEIGYGVGNFGRLTEAA